jgi:hypothetical protein
MMKRILAVAFGAALSLGGMPQKVSWIPPPICPPMCVNGN